MTSIVPLPTSLANAFLQNKSSKDANGLEQVHGYSFPLDSVQCVLFSFLLAVLTISAPYGSPLRLGLLFLNIVFLAQAYIAPTPAGVYNPAFLYTSGVFIGNMSARYVDRLYLRVPERDFHRINHKDGTKEDPNKLPLVKKLLWAFELLTVTRGIGWNWSVARTPSAKRQTKGQFIRVRLFKYVIMYTGLYVTVSLCRGILDDFVGIQNVRLREYLVLVTNNALFLHVLIVLGWAMTIYSHFGILLLPLSILCVGLEVGPESWQDPKGWPPNFGHIKEAYSIRRFWGITWHQQLRRITGSPGTQLLSHAPTSFLQSRSLAARLSRRYFLILSAFIISGLIHTSGTYNVTRALNLPFSDGGEFKYYSSQGLAIIVEDFVCWLLSIDDQRQKPSAIRKVVGYVATAGWYTWSRVALKALPITTAHGIRAEKGDLYVAVKLIELSASAVPGNFVTATMEYLKR